MTGRLLLLPRALPFALNTRQKVALARLASSGLRLCRRAIGLSEIAQVERDGVHWRLDLAEGIDLAVYLFGHFEPTTVAAYRRLVRPGHTVVDIGANIGAHTLHLAVAVGPRGRVLAVEPTSYAFTKLLANLALNPDLAPRVIARQAMLGPPGRARPPPAIFSSWPLIGAEGSRDPVHQGALKSTTGAVGVSLDDLLEREQLETVDFIKMDVDGFECEVLAGAQRTLAKDRPAIVMELAPAALESQGQSLESLVGMLTTLGYRLYRERDDVLLPESVERLRALIPEGGSINAVARAPHPHPVG